MRKLLYKLYNTPAGRCVRPVWRGAKWLRRSVIDSYRSLVVDRITGGAVVTMGSHHLRLPARIAALWTARAGYDEEPAFNAFLEWCCAHPTGLVLDIGCEIGKYAVFAAHKSDVSVIAFDSDTDSLRAVSDAVTQLPSGRVRLVYGFVTDSGDGSEINQAVAATDERLRTAKSKSVSPQFVCIGDHGAESTPRNSIDALFRTLSPSQPILMKIDVEGAESLVLAGATTFLKTHHPVMLLSLHPDMIVNFSTTADDILGGIRTLGYKTQLLGVDHEEHWWCEWAPQ